MKQPIHNAYNRLGRMTSALVAGISTNAYTYDPDTLALSVETQNGMEINRTTDALGRATGFSLVGSDYVVTYGFDAYGRFHSVSSSVQSVATYTYLPGSDLVSGMSTSSGFLWTCAYESGRSLITSVENRYGETVISRYNYANDELGRRTSRADSGLAFAAQPTFGDPATVEMPAYNAYAYNTRSEVTGAARRWGTPGAPGDLVLGQQYAYEFDPIGNRITAEEGDTSRSSSYTANALNQYTQRTVPDEKDLIGTAPTNVAVTVNQNPASRQSAYWHHALEVDNATDAAYPQVAITAVYNPPGTNDPDVVTSQTGRVFVAETPEQFQYDDDGNLTQDGRFTYTWDAENRLSGVTTRTDLPASVPRVRVEYVYDHQSRRIASATAVWTNDAWQATESRAFLYDGWNVVTELTHSQTHTLTNLYTWGLDLSGSLQGAGGIGGLLAASLDGTTDLYCYDANGNVGQLVSTDGELLAHYEYSPFGETIGSTGPLAKANPFRFSTKHWDDLTGLGYWGYRYYHPDMGRWVNRDPIGEEGGWNLFVITYNNEINLVDYLGQFSLKYTPPQNSVVTPFELGIEWLTGLGPRYRDFTDGDAFAEQMRGHKHIQTKIKEVTDTVTEMCNNDCSFSGPYVLSGQDANYNLSGIRGVANYLGDYSNLITFGAFGNLAVTFTGSYSATFTVPSIDCCKNVADLRIVMNNRSHAASALRPPVLCYTDWWQKHIAPRVNRLFQSGPGSPTTQRVTLTETLTLSSNCSSK